MPKTLYLANTYGFLGPTAWGLAVGAVQRHVRERVAPDPDAAPSLRAPLGWECVVSHGEPPAADQARLPPALVLPTWKQVLDRHYEPWKSAQVIDAAGRTLEDILSQRENSQACINRLRCTGSRARSFA